jgi:hypothetical protein
MTPASTSSAIGKMHEHNVQTTERLSERIRSDGENAVHGLEWDSNLSRASRAPAEKWGAKARPLVFLRLALFGRRVQATVELGYRFPQRPGDQLVTM